jgi:hypothetical protein
MICSLHSLTFSCWYVGFGRPFKVLSHALKLAREVWSAGVVARVPTCLNDDCKEFLLWNWLWVLLVSRE